MTHDYGASELAGMMIAAKKILDEHRSEIDALNVFPVPDGDTGLNMSLTMQSACDEMEKISSKDDLAMICQAIAKGSLMGARGNSGVILSQIFRGFTKSISVSNTFDAQSFATALRDGVSVAYKSVMKPVEGTILTVSREASAAACQRAEAGDDFVTVIAEALQQAEVALRKTPELLPVLKEAGVVDAGGMGFLQILRGFYHFIAGEDGSFENSDNDFLSRIDHHSSNDYLRYFSLEEIVHRYCSEVMIYDIKKEISRDIEEQLASLGDSLVIVPDEYSLKIHVHTNYPDQLLSLCMSIGGISNVKIENMHLQFLHSQKRLSQEFVEGVGIIAVCAGEGVADFFRGLGATFILNGGQTMNPSTEQIVAAIKDCNYTDVIVLPNNSNIIMAAQQAIELCPGQRVKVLPTKTIPQGISAMLEYVDDLAMEDNYLRMEAALHHVLTVEITFAVRDTVNNGIKIQKSDIIGLLDGKIVKAGHDKDDIVVEMLSEILDAGKEIVTVIAGADVDESDAVALMARLKEIDEKVEFELYFGGQPLYFYIISIE
jgi:hypothetical protein